ncbi:MAG: ASCH domain-containing protein [Clostridia bacterium]|nr:ASCH domain-containing protein [Clostridia bacterium]
MTHEMKLQEAPFTSIKAGTKTIEMRLYDEKRKKISIGDEIVFTNVANGEIIKTKVLALHCFASFDELYKAFDKVKLGYEPNEDANPEDMKKYYDVEEMKENGVVGIEIQLVD